MPSPVSGDSHVADSLSRLKIDRNEFGNAPLFHGHTEQPVHPRHRHPVVGDDKETRIRLGGDFAQQIAEPRHICVVERRIHLVENADRGRICQENRENQGESGQSLFAARQQRERLQPLARRLRQDLEPCFQRVVRFRQLQLGGTAAEQDLEQLAKMPVDRSETRQKLLTALPVQLVY